MTKSIKRILLVLCSALCLLFTGIAIVDMPKRSVSVAAANVDGYGFTLNDRVALRIGGSGGVRFSGSIENAYLETVSEYGIILADEVTYHRNGELTIEKKNAVANNNNGLLKTTVSGDVTYFNVALYGIKENNIARNYIAKGYVLVDGVYRYTQEVTVNPYELAKRAYVENQITDNAVINDYLERVVDVALDADNKVTVTSPLEGVTTINGNVEYDADQTLGYSGIDKKVAALYINGTKVAAAYTDLALSSWGNVEVTMEGATEAYEALLNVNGASFEKGKVIFDASSVLPTEKSNWLDGLTASGSISSTVKYLESAYSAHAKSVALNSGENVVTLPQTDYDTEIRNFRANYLRIRLAFSNAGQSLKVNGLNNNQDVAITASEAGENVLLSMTKTNELYVFYTATGKSVYLGSIPQDVFFGNGTLSFTVNGASGESIEISPFFLSKSDRINSAGDAVLNGGDLALNNDKQAPDGSIGFTETAGVWTNSLLDKGFQVYLQKVTKNNAVVVSKYWRVLTTEYKYSDYSSVTFYIGNNIAGYKYYNQDGQALFTVSDKTMHKVRIEQDGSVYFDGVKSANKMNSNGQIVFHIETTATHGATGNYYGELQLSKFIVLGDGATAVAAIDKAKISSAGLDAVNNYFDSYPTTAGGVSEDGTLIDFGGAYRTYVQDIKTESGSTWHRYFKMTLNKDYRDYDGLTFYIWTNTAAANGAMKIQIEGETIASLASQTTMKITVLSDGAILVDDVATGAYMTDGVTALYLDTQRTSAGYYGELHVAKTIFVGDAAEALVASELKLDGVDEWVDENAVSYETPQTDTEYTAICGHDGWNKDYGGMDLLASYNQKAIVNGSTVGWKYYRVTLGVDFRAANETSFYWVNNNSREVATDIYLNGGKPLVSMYPKTLMKFTINKDGYVFINDDTVASGQIKTEKAIFYLNTNSAWHNVANDQYYGTLLLSNITQDGAVVASISDGTYQSMYALVGVAESSFPAPTQYIVGAGDGSGFFYQTPTDTYNGSSVPMNSGDNQMAKTDGTNAVAHYKYRAIFDYYTLNYKEYNSTEFYLSSNRNNVEFFVNGVSLGKLNTASVCLKIKIDKQGYIYVNDGAVALTRISGKLIVDIQMPELSYNQFHISQQVWKDGAATTLDKSKVRVWGIPAISTATLASSVDEVATTPSEYSSWEARTDAPGITGDAYWMNIEKKVENGTRYCWSYWRFTMNLNYKTYESVSFYLSARQTAFDLYMYQTKIATIAADTAVKVTVDQFGNVYLNDNTQSVGTLKGENIVFDLNTHNAQHGSTTGNHYGIRWSVSKTVTTNKGDIAISDSIMSTVAVNEDVLIAPEKVETTYTPNQGGGNFEVFTNGSVTEPTDVILNGYSTELGTVNGVAWELYEVGFDVNPANYDGVIFHLAASSDVDVYAGVIKLGAISANAWARITVYADGSVAFNGVLIDGAKITSDFVSFKVNTKGANGVTLKTFAFASANLGESKIDLQDKITVRTTAMSAILEGAWTQSGDSWSYNYQNTSSVSTTEKAILTLAYGYTAYGKIGFTLTSNLDGVNVYASNEADATVLATLTAYTAVEFLVDNDGYVYVNGIQTGRLTTSTTTLYIGVSEIVDTAEAYYTVSVGKTISLVGNYSIVGDNEVGVGVTEDILIDNGTSEYVILKGTTDEYVDFAAQEVQSVLAGATGVTLPVATVLTEETKDSKYILIGGNAVPMAINAKDNPISGNFSGASSRDASAEEKNAMGITKVHSFTYTGWKHAWFDSVDLTTHDEWIFYAKNDAVGTNLGFMANGGDNQNVITYLTEVEGWQEFRLVRNPNGQYGNSTYNVYHNGELKWHPAVGKKGEDNYIAPTIVELNGNASKLAWNSPAKGAAVSYTNLLAVEKTPVAGAESMLVGTGNSGYALKTIDGNIYVLSNSTFGAMTGALDMLTYMVDYEAYASNVVYYDTVTTLPVQAFDHTFKALIDERHYHEAATTDNDENRYRMKLQEQRDEWSAWAHTTVSQFLPVGTYGSNYSTSIDSNGITNVQLNVSTLQNKVGTPTGDTVYTFEYKQWLFSNYWYYGSTRNIKLSDYGISITGSPSQGDKIEVTYSASAQNHVDWYNAAGNQICYGTALGDTTTADGMYQTFLANVKNQLIGYFSQSQNAGKKSIYLSLGHEDNNMYCDCAKCVAIMNGFGGATGGGFAAIQLQFASKIAEDVNAWLPSAGLVDKDIKFVILAYGTAGRVVPTKGLTIHEDVCVMIAPIESFYNVDIYNEANSLVYDRLTGWNEYLKNNGRENGLVVYNYALNGMCYMFPTNNVAAGSFYEAFAANNVSYVYTQGAGTTTASFEQLRIYVESKLMYDAKYSREELIKDFIMHYYDDANNPTGSGEIMLKFYNELEDYYAYLSRSTYDMYKNGTGSADENGNGFNGYWHCDMFGPMDTSRSTGSAPTYWTTEKLNGFITQIKAAEKAITDSNLDETVKEALIIRVERELIFPMFVSVATSYANYYDANDLNGTGTKDGFYDFDVKLTAAEKEHYVSMLKALTSSRGIVKIYEASSLQWRNGLGIVTNNIGEYLTTLENTGNKWYKKAD